MSQLYLTFFLLLCIQFSFIYSAPCVAPNSNCFAEIGADDILGYYERRPPPTNNWHYGTLTLNNEGNYVWNNYANAQWTMIPHILDGYLEAQNDNPYYNSNPNNRNFDLVLTEINGECTTSLEHFSFLGEEYHLQSLTTTPPSNICDCDIGNSGRVGDTVRNINDCFECPVDTFNSEVGGVCISCSNGFSTFNQTGQVACSQISNGGEDSLTDGIFEDVNDFVILAIAASGAFIIVVVPAVIIARSNDGISENEAESEKRELVNHWNVNNFDKSKSGGQENNGVPPPSYPGASKPTSRSSPQRKRSNGRRGSEGRRRKGSKGKVTSTGRKRSTSAVSKSKSKSKPIRPISMATDITQVSEKLQRIPATIAVSDGTRATYDDM